MFRTLPAGKRSIALTLSILLVASTVTAVPGLMFLVQPAAANSHSTIAVAQGTSCYQVTPVGDGSQTVEEFYDYRNPETDPSSRLYSSYGTTEYQETSVSSMLFYHGANGTSLVAVHGRKEDGAGGSTITWDISGLPADGDLAVQDDYYQNGTQDDNFDYNDGDPTASIDWMYADNRNDGAAFRGLESDNFDTITIDPGYNEEAAYWGRWNWSGSDQYRVDAWRLKEAGGTTVADLSLNQRVFIHPGQCVEQAPPEAVIDSPGSAMTDETVTFDASGSGDAAGYEWDFDGDGTVDATTTGPTATHTYATSGNYTASVTTFDTYGNADTAETQVNVTEPDDPPNASLSAPSSATVNESVPLDASSSTDDEGISEYRWDFEGDGTIDETTTGPTTSTTYSSTGEYDVRVTVVDTAGATDTASQTLTVSEPNDPPTATLTAPDSANASEPVTFNASSSTDGDGTVVEYRWDFDGDGTVDRTTTGPVTDFTFDSGGTYNASVTVVDDGGSTDEAFAEVTVSEPDTPPNASLSAPSSATVNESVPFDASGSTDDGTIAEYRWDFEGDGTIDATTAGPRTEFTYTRSGTYAATVTVVDDAGNTDTVSAEVNVGEEPNQSPNASLSTPDSANASEPVTLDASSSMDGDGTVVEYRWDFDGDGTVDRTTTAATVEHTYSEANEYTPTVTVVDNDGSADTARGSISVTFASDPPTAALSTPATATVNESVLFDASGSTPADALVEYRWDFDGDGTIDSTTNDPTVEHAYAEADEYEPSVTVVDEHGRMDTRTVGVSVSDAPLSPTIDASATDVAPGETVTFDAGSSSPADRITDYEWTFGDGANDTGVTADHAYDEAGTYEVTLQVTASDGTTAETTMTVTVTEEGGNGNDGGDSSGGDDPPEDDTGNDGNNGGDNDGGNNAGSNDGGNNNDNGNGGVGDAPASGGTTGVSDNDSPTPDPKPVFELSGVNATVSELVAGEEAAFSVTVRNTGNASGSKNVTFAVNGTTLANEKVELAPNERESVSFTHQFTTAGNVNVTVGNATPVEIRVLPAEARLSVTDVSTATDTVTANERVRINATVRNDGYVEGSMELRLTLFGEVVAVKSVSVPPGETRTVTFTRQVNAPGTYTASIAGQSVTVDVAADTDTQTPTTETTATTTPGFTAFAAIVALLVSLAAAVVRRTD